MYVTYYAEQGIKHESTVVLCTEFMTSNMHWDLPHTGLQCSVHLYRVQDLKPDQYSAVIPEGGAIQSKGGAWTHSLQVLSSSSFSTQRCAPNIFRGYKCLRFSLIKHVLQTFIPMNLISHACCKKAAITRKLNPQKPF